MQSSGGNAAYSGMANLCFIRGKNKMKMNKSVLQRGIIFILCICILFSICPVYAFAAGNQKEKIVRIGVSDAKYVKS